MEQKLIFKIGNLNPTWGQRAVLRVQLISEFVFSLFSVITLFSTHRDIKHRDIISTYNTQLLDSF